MKNENNIKTLVDMQSEFNKIYYKHIAPAMKEWERKRIKMLILFNMVLVAIGIIIITIRNCLYSVIHIEFIFIGGMIFLPLALWSMYLICVSFSKNLKKACLPIILKAFGDIHWQSGERVVLNNDLVESELFANFNRRIDDDAFWGKYKDVNYQIAETHLYYMSSGRNKITYNVFKGVVINFDANKPIKNKTMIVTRGDMNIKGRDWTYIYILLVIVLDFIIQYLTSGSFIMLDWKSFIIPFVGIGLALLFFVYIPSRLKKEKLSNIILEDVDFNKKHTAYSSDEVEGRYLLTTAFMERFKNLQTAFGAKGAKCAFYDDNIMIAISTSKNLFEIGSLFTPLTTTKHMKTFYNELSSILLLIDHFKLNERIGL